MTDHAREKSDLPPDLVPQGSIPQVLERLEERIALKPCGCVGGCLMWNVGDKYCEFGRSADDELLRDALTALRSLPPVPMQEIKDQDSRVDKSNCPRLPVTTAGKD